MIKFSNISKSYKKDTWAVKDLNLEIKNGEIFGLLGPNGAGKSTTIKMLVGILEPSAGSIEVEGFNRQKESISIKQIMSFVPDNPDIYTKQTGMGYLNFLADIYELKKDVRHQRIKELDSIFELKDALYQDVESYSHGMRQKLVLIGALLIDPKVLVLDEPMVGLDVKTAFKLKQVLRQEADNGKIIIFSTHVLEVAQKICDRFAIINKGEVIFVGTMDDLKQGKEEIGDLEQIFLELTDDEK